MRVICNNDALEQLNKILFYFNKHIKNLDLIYNIGYSPITTPKIQMFLENRKSNNGNNHYQFPLFESDKQTPINLITDSIQTYSNTKFYKNKKEIKRTYDEDFDEEYFDPNEFRIINSLNKNMMEKIALFDDFKEIQSEINSDIGFTLQIKE